MELHRFFASEANRHDCCEDLLGVPGVLWRLHCWSLGLRSPLVSRLQGVGTQLHSVRQALKWSSSQPFHEGCLVQKMAGVRFDTAICSFWSVAAAALLAVEGRTPAVSILWSVAVSTTRARSPSGTGAVIWNWLLHPGGFQVPGAGLPVLCGGHCAFGRFLPKQ